MRSVARDAENVFSRYLGAGEVTPGVIGDSHRGEVTSDMTTGFVTLCAIYFPSVTGASSIHLLLPQRRLLAGA